MIVSQTVLLAAAATLFLAGSTFTPRAHGASRYDGRWQYKEDDREDRYRRGGSAARDPINSVDYDIRTMQRAASPHVDGEKRRLFRDTLHDLDRFRVNAQRGKFDTDRLDGAIDNMKRLLGSDQIPPRMKRVLARDIELLREFRASGGYASRGGNRW